MKPTMRKIKEVVKKNAKVDKSRDKVVNVVSSASRFSGLVNINNKEQVLEYISINQRKSTQKNKDAFGEVFTPAILIDEILDNLPAHVWRTPEYKWLDPCAGGGNFFLLVYGRLMNGLSLKIPDSVERQNHILSNMLFMNELNPQNMRVLKTVFGDDKNKTAYKLNITQHDFLSSEFPENMKYNVILENPPYQVSKTAVYKGARGTNNTLWDKFVEKSFKMLNEKEGWLGAITPANWRRPGHYLYETILSPHLKYLHIYNKKDGLRIFNAQTRFDVYIATTAVSVSASAPPRIIDEKGVIHTNMKLTEWGFFPNYNYNGVKRFFSLKKKKHTTKKIVYNSNEYNSKVLSKRRTAKYKYPVVHTITKKGLGVRWSSTKKGHFQTPKVLLNFNEKQYPYNDWKGEYGMSQLTFGIPIQSKKEGDKWVDILNTDKFKEVVKATKWGSFQTDYKMFEYLKDL